MQDRSFNSFASNMTKLSVIEAKWSILLARTRALILYISIWIFDFGPEKLSGRNGPLTCWLLVLNNSARMEEIFKFRLVKLLMRSKNHKWSDCNQNIIVSSEFQCRNFLPHGLTERFSYDLEMKTREQNRNNKRTEIERFDWFIERIQTRVAFGWLSERSGEKTSCPRTF